MTLGERRGGAVRLAGWAVAFTCAVGASGEALAKPPLRLAGQGIGEPASPPVPVIAPGPPGSTTLVSVDANTQRALANALRYIGQGEFDSAAEVLQLLLSRADAGFVATDDRGRYRATAARVNEVLGSMGDQGLARYRLLYDAKAAALLQQASGQGGEKLLLQVAREYLYTQSGPAALEALGNLRFDQGQFDAAGRYWQQAAVAGEESLRPGRLAKRAVALHLGGQEAQAKVQVEELSKRYPDATVAMGGREWKLREFLTWAGRLAPAAAQTRAAPAQGEWLGTASGASLAGMSDCNVVPSPQWQAAEPASGAPGAPAEGLPLMAMRPWVQRPGDGIVFPQVVRKGGHVVIRWQRKDGGNGGATPGQDQPLVAAMDPLVVGGLVICRHDDGVAAYDLTGARTGEPGRRVWMSPPLPAPAPGSGVPQAWFADASGYSITSDGRRVFLVARAPAAVPPTQPPRVDMNPLQKNRGQEVETMVRTAVAEIPPALVGLSLADGKWLWSVGGGAGDGGDESLRLAGFFSAPAVQGGRLYAAAILKNVIYLVCMDAGGVVLWKAPIAESPAGRPIWMAGRSLPGPVTTGASIALADGMVFLCTNTGVLACVDADSGQALWARQYVDSATLLARSRGGGFVLRPDGLGGNLNPLLVLEGKVICLPGDLPTLLAVSAADGKLLWSRPSPGQTELSALDSGRVLLSSPGLTVVDAATGGVLFDQADLGLRGRPAVGPAAVMAGGQGQLVRMDLKTYAITRTNLASTEAMLGNLVAVGGRLVAANASGLYVYADYDDSRRELDRRLAGAGGEARDKLLLERGTLACHAGRFDEALADLKAVLEQGGESGVLVDAAREWQMRTYVARGDRRDRASDMAADFQLAYDAAGTPARQAQMLVRLAKARRLEADQAGGDEPRKIEALRQAVEAAHRLAESFQGQSIADVPVGPAALAQAPDVPEMTDARAWAMATFLPPLLKEHGQACYAPWDAQAQQALAKALAVDDLTALLAVRDRWPNSRHVPGSLISAAECIFRRQTAAPAPDEGEMDRAYGLLADAEDRAEPRALVTSLAGRAVIAARRTGAGPLGWILAQQIRQACTAASISLGEPVAFNRNDMPLKALLEDLDGRAPVAAPPAPGPEASLSGPVEPLFTLEGDYYFVRDQAWQAVRQGTHLLAIRDDRLIWLDTAAPNADKALRWETKVPIASGELRGYMYGAPGFTLVGALAPDGQSVLVAGRTWAMALDTADGKPRWKEPVNIAALCGGQIHSMSVANGRLLVQDCAGRVLCLDGSDGKVAWRADLSKDLLRFDAPPQMAGELAVLQGCAAKKAACLDLRTGKLRAVWSSGQYVSARALPCGLVAVLADGVCSLYSMAGSSPVSRAIWTRRYDVSLKPAIVGADGSRLFISDNWIAPTLDVIRVDNKQMPAVKLAAVEGTVCAVHAAGGALYLTVGRDVQGLRGSRPIGQVVIHPMSIHKVDAATGREIWKDMNQELSTASFPLTQAGATVAVTVGGTTFGTGMLVALLGTSDGRRIQTVELVGRPHPLYSASALGARYLSVGPAHVVADRLCTEGLAGITVYRVKDAPTPQKP